MYKIMKNPKGFVKISGQKFYEAASLGLIDALPRLTHTPVPSGIAFVIHNHLRSKLQDGILNDPAGQGTPSSSEIAANMGEVFLGLANGTKVALDVLRSLQDAKLTDFMANSAPLVAAIEQVSMAQHNMKPGSSSTEAFAMSSDSIAQLITSPKSSKETWMLTSDSIYKELYGAMTSSDGHGNYVGGQVNAAAKNSDEDDKGHPFDGYVTSLIIAHYVSVLSDPDQINSAIFEGDLSLNAPSGIQFRIRGLEQLHAFLTSSARLGWMAVASLTKATADHVAEMAGGLIATPSQVQLEDMRSKMFIPYDIFDTEGWANDVVTQLDCVHSGLKGLLSGFIPDVLFSSQVEFDQVKGRVKSSMGQLTNLESSMESFSSRTIGDVPDELYSMLLSVPISEHMRPTTALAIGPMIAVSTGLTEKGIDATMTAIQGYFTEVDPKASAALRPKVSLGNVSSMPAWSHAFTLAIRGDVSSRKIVMNSVALSSEVIADLSNSLNKPVVAKTSDLVEAIGAVAGKGQGNRFVANYDVRSADLLAKEVSGQEKRRGLVPANYAGGTIVATPGELDVNRTVTFMTGLPLRHLLELIHAPIIGKDYLSLLSGAMVIAELDDNYNASTSNLRGWGSPQGMEWDVYASTSTAIVDWNKTSHDKVQAIAEKDATSGKIDIVGGKGGAIVGSAYVLDDGNRYIAFPVTRIHFSDKKLVSQSVDGRLINEWSSQGSKSIGKACYNNVSGYVEVPAYTHFFRSHDEHMDLSSNPKRAYKGGMVFDTATISIFGKGTQDVMGKSVDLVKQTNWAGLKPHLATKHTSLASVLSIQEKGIDMAELDLSMHDLLSEAKAERKEVVTDIEEAVTQTSVSLEGAAEESASVDKRERV